MNNLGLMMIGSVIQRSVGATALDHDEEELLWNLKMLHFMDSF